MEPALGQGLILGPETTSHQKRARYRSASMPNLLVRDVPETVHAVLQQRAARRGQSLQQYLVAELERMASKPSLQEVLARIEQRTGGRVGLAQAIEDIAEERSGR